MQVTERVRVDANVAHVQKKGLAVVSTYILHLWFTNTHIKNKNWKPQQENNISGLGKERCRTNSNSYCEVSDLNTASPRFRGELVQRTWLRSGHDIAWGRANIRARFCFLNTVYMRYSSQVYWTSHVLIVMYFLGINIIIAFYALQIFVGERNWIAANEIKLPISIR